MAATRAPTAAVCHGLVGGNAVGHFGVYGGNAGGCFVGYACAYGSGVTG